MLGITRRTIDLTQVRTIEVVESISSDKWQAFLQQNPHRYQTLRLTGIVKLQTVFCLHFEQTDKAFLLFLPNTVRETERFVYALEAALQ